MKNKPGSMKNYDNPGGAMKNHENIPGTIKKSGKPTWNHENPSWNQEKPFIMESGTTIKNHMAP